MDLDNHTPLPAAQVQSGHGDEMLTLLLICATYDIVDGPVDDDFIMNTPLRVSWQRG